MALERALEPRRTLNDIRRDFLDALSEEFGFQLDLEHVSPEDTDYIYACSEVSEYINEYAVQRYLGVISRAFPELGLKPDEAKLSEFKELIVDQLMELRSLSISADDEPDRVIPMNIKPDESREMIEDRFDHAISLVVATLTPNKSSRLRE
jgi:hypothetical protein